MLPSSPHDSQQRLLDEVASLKQRLHDLESRVPAPAAPRRSKFLLLLGFGIAVAGGTVFAANGTCPNGLPWCFLADSPAEASKVNHNFAQLKEWIELKTGAVAAANISTTGLTSSGTISASGVMVPAGAQGAQLLWNTVTSGIGQTELVNNRGLGSGGFSFFDRQYTTTGGQPARLLDMTSDRANFSGRVGGNGTLCVAHTACEDGTVVSCGQTTTCPNGKFMVAMTDGTSCSVANKARCCALALTPCP